MRASPLRRPPPSEQTRKPHGTLKDYEVGFVHVDVKHLPKPRDRYGTTSKHHLHVAIDRASHHVHSTAKDNETAASAVAFLTDAFDAFPFRLHTCSPDGNPVLRSMFSSQPASGTKCRSQDASPHAEDRWHS